MRLFAAAEPVATAGPVTGRWAGTERQVPQLPGSKADSAVVERVAAGDSVVGATAMIERRGRGRRAHGASSQADRCHGGHNGSLEPRHIFHLPPAVRCHYSQSRRRPGGINGGGPTPGPVSSTNSTHCATASMIRTDIRSAPTGNPSHLNQIRLAVFLLPCSGMRARLRRAASDLLDPG